ncbi:MAG: hypothetical protein KAW17_08055 [Candidatus Eisenbacteria sp.]|nr:hypothetical protein [Candidatus Eisenbacteria bacterium]
MLIFMQINMTVKDFLDEGRGVSPGVYLVRIDTGGSVRTGRVVLVK